MVMQRTIGWLVTLAMLPLLGACSGGPGPTHSTASRAPAPDSRAMEAAASQRSPFIGQQAPAFVLLDENNQPVSLANHRGRWVVIYFYPQNDTPGCTCQANEFTDLLKSFRESNAVILGISPDSPESHRHFKDQYAIRIKLLSDPNHQVMSRYGAWVQSQYNDQSVPRVIRSTVLVDPAGRVAWHWPEVIPEGHAARVQEKLKELSR